jgi:hypothetical protein
MNPFSALQVSDDEEEFTATSNPQTKQPKKSTHRLTQHISSESRPRKPKSRKPNSNPNPPPPMRNSPKRRRKTLVRSATTK